MGWTVRECSTCRSLLGCERVRGGGPTGFPCWSGDESQHRTMKATSDWDKAKELEAEDRHRRLQKLEQTPYAYWSEGDLQLFTILNVYNDCALQQAIAEIRRLRADNARLNKARVHCEHCGADYLATGVEAGCPCKLKAEIERITVARDVYREHWGELLAARAEVERLEAVPRTRDGAPVFIGGPVLRVWAIVPGQFPLYSIGVNRETIWENGLGATNIAGVGCAFADSYSSREVAEAALKGTAAIPITETQLRYDLSGE